VEALMIVDVPNDFYARAQLRAQLESRKIDASVGHRAH
jgi:hypothetical protein